MVAFIKTGKLPRNDLTGQRFERLLVKGWLGRNSSRLNYWECICDCGKVKNVYGSHLATGDSKSCGCFSRENTTTHGMHNTQVYRAWQHMKSRCLNPSNKYWKYYGGRGITISQQWINSFEQFYADIGDPPSLKHSIDRMDNDKGYYPENVHWATIQEQANNKTTNRFINFNGETKTVAQFARIYNVHPRTFLNRLDRGWSVERALTTPARTCCRSTRGGIETGT